MSVMKIKKDDLVEVTAGNEKGKRGKVLRVIGEKDRAVVEGVNVVKRHARPSQTSQGGIIEKEASLHLSNLSPVCDKCDRPVRIRTKVLGDGGKARVCVKCGETIGK